ncbi:hypothetical protein A3462_05985 [Enterobacter bugandensis]|jgi:hypothetical protein|uniref:hypothetical protein n=1 Tax=Enterobacter bugandensis TaxID=881260 RepID=UPI0007B32B42|nr:hypothetical protein [Enterobacter bugandensis]KZP65742.1 hypothetical protein A3462_05985 [Enterobacter bugandensis]
MIISATNGISGNPILTHIFPQQCAARKATGYIALLVGFMLYSSHSFAACNFVDGNGPWTAWVSIPSDLTIPSNSQVGDIIHSDAGWQQLGTTHLRCTTSGQTYTGYDFAIEKSSIAGVYKLPGMPELGIRITYDNTHNNSELGNTIFHYPQVTGPHSNTGFTPTGNFKVEIILLSSLVNFTPGNYTVSWPDVIGSVRYSDLLVGTVKPLSSTMNITVTNDEYCYLSAVETLNFSNMAITQLISSQSLGNRSVNVTCPYTTTHESFIRRVRFNGNASGNQFLGEHQGITLQLRDSEDNVIPPGGAVDVTLMKENTGHGGQTMIHLIPVVDDNNIPTMADLGEWQIHLLLE